MRPNLASLTLPKLELQIDRLILICQELQQKNQMLSDQIIQLKSEKAILLSQNQQAVSQIKQVIGQLREEIHERSA